MGQKPHSITSPELPHSLFIMTSTHSQKVLKMLNDKLLETYDRYYEGLKVGDMTPKEFIKTYGTIEDRVNGSLKKRNYSF